MYQYSSKTRQQIQRERKKKEKLKKAHWIPIMYKQTLPRHKHTILFISSRSAVEPDLDLPQTQIHQLGRHAMPGKGISLHKTNALLSAYIRVQYYYY